MTNGTKDQTPPERTAISSKTLRMIVIYHHATDYPEHNFVARQWFVIAGKIWAQRRLYATGTTLREVRAGIPSWMVCIPRQPGEDEAIIETWV